MKTIVTDSESKITKKKVHMPIVDSNFALIGWAELLLGPEWEWEFLKWLPERLGETYFWSVKSSSVKGLPV